MEAYEYILVETHEHVGLIRLNRPEALNALNRSVWAELNRALAAFDADAAIRALVIAGDERAFAAGADIKEMLDMSAVQMLKSDPVAVFDEIRSIKKPIIAAVSGWCLGGGNELAMSCDMIVASQTAMFGQPEINLGVIPGAGGTQRLTRAVGKAIAMEMILNNRTLTADEAYQFGLVNRVVPVKRYLEEALELAAEIAARAPLALRMGKEVINHAFETTLSEGLSVERRAFYLLFASADQKEGMTAFTEKRKPTWTGE